MRLFSAMILVVGLLVFVFTACGSGGGGGGGDNSSNNPPVNTPNPTYAWQQYEVKDLSGSSGLLATNVRAVEANNGDVHVAYFTDGIKVDGERRYTLNHEVLAEDDFQVKTKSTLNPKPPTDQVGDKDIDNSYPFALALDANDTPALLYCGGNPRAQSSDGDVQSDLMISVKDGNHWQEAFAAIGYVARQPIYEHRDGLATFDDWFVFDSSGDIHMAFQFYYEGMDEVPPDVNYVKWERNALPATELASLDDWADIEEQVYGNEFPNQNHGIHRDVGYSTKIILDENEDPVVFFAEKIVKDSNHGLHVAWRNGSGEWEREWVEKCSTDFSIGRISAALAPDGSLSVAYQVKCDNPSLADDGDYLKFARKVGDLWIKEVVDNRSHCGDYCVLAFDSGGNPAIAYFDEKSRAGNVRNDLKLAQLDGSTWKSETVADIDDIGIYNSLWFDDDDLPVICTYSDSDKKIYIFRKTLADS